MNKAVKQHLLLTCARWSERGPAISLQQEENDLLGYVLDNGKEKKKIKVLDEAKEAMRIKQQCVVCPLLYVTACTVHILRPPKMQTS